MYDKNGKLTRAAAEQIIRGGGSVSVGSRIYSSVETLPSESDFAKGDPAAEANARASLEAQRKAIDAQLESLGTANDPTPGATRSHPAGTGKPAGATK